LAVPDLGTSLGPYAALAVPPPQCRRDAAIWPSFAYGRYISAGRATSAWYRTCVILRHARAAIGAPGC